jgi:hypothetical protein
MSDGGNLIGLLCILSGLVLVVELAVVLLLGMIKTRLVSVENSVDIQGIAVRGLLARANREAVDELARQGGPLWAQPPQSRMPS